MKEGLKKVEKKKEMDKKRGEKKIMLAKIGKKGRI